MSINTVNLSLDGIIPATQYFKWKEFLLLREWGFCAYPDEDQYTNIVDTAYRLELVRKYFGKPIHIRSGLRPKAYNDEIGGSTSSQHMLGKAADFVIESISCDHVREMLEPQLEAFGIRMENLPGANWIHIDTRRVGNKRYFNPRPSN